MEKPEQQMAALFEGLSRIERLTLLGRLERAGAQVYRLLAADEKNEKAKAALLKAAEDEERNGGLLRLMSTSKPKCEKCDKALPDQADGFACSFQCTFCGACTTQLNFVCPNCGGTLEKRADLQLR